MPPPLSPTRAVTRPASSRRVQWDRTLCSPYLKLPAPRRYGDEVGREGAARCLLWVGNLSLAYFLLASHRPSAPTTVALSLHSPLQAGTASSMYSNRGSPHVLHTNVSPAERGLQTQRIVNVDGRLPILAQDTANQELESEKQQRQGPTACARKTVTEECTLTISSKYPLERPATLPQASTGAARASVVYSRDS